MNAIVLQQTHFHGGEAHPQGRTRCEIAAVWGRAAVCAVILGFICNRRAGHTLPPAPPRKGQIVPPLLCSTTAGQPDRDTGHKRPRSSQETHPKGDGDAPETRTVAPPLQCGSQPPPGVDARRMTGNVLRKVKTQEPVKLKAKGELLGHVFGGKGLQVHS